MMMELSCVFVLTLAGLVAGNPYGYGVKGGAGAKADATAAAGAFSGLGNIPSGAAYSGSFSKSSASSFASSSASASSFSYSSSGGLTGPGCTSEGCRKGSDGGISQGNGGATTGTGFPAQSGSKAAAIAGASAGSYSQIPGNAPCVGDCTNQKSPSCQGSSCSDTSKCSSGQCGTSSSLTNTESDDGNNDIPVNVAGTAASKANSNVQSTHYDKAANGYQSPTAGCSNGNCGSGSNQNPQYPQANINLTPGSDDLKTKCNTPYCNDNGQRGDVPTPSTHLTAPKDYPNPGTGRLPLNYNAASQNAYPTPAADEKGSPCSAGKCNNNNYPDGAYSPSNGNSYTSNYLSPNYPNTEPKDLLNGNGCKSGNCATNTNTNETPKYPSYSHTSYQTPSASGGNCASGNCGSYPSPTPSHHSSAVSYSDTKLPGYPQTPSGLGADCASGNCGSNPSGPSPTSAGTTYPSSKFPIYPQAPSSSVSNCASGNCGSYLSPASSTAGTTNYPGNKIPSYSQISAIPAANCASGNCGSYPSPSGLGGDCASGNCGSNRSAPSPTSASKTYPSSKFPIYSPVPSSSGSNCASGNCGIYPSPAPSTAGTTNYPGTKIPSYSQISAIPAANCASGNCGSYPSPVPSASTYSGTKIPSYSQAPSNPGANCASGNCGSYPSLAQTGSTSSGSTYPNFNNPSYSHSPSSTTGNCASGNCGAYSPPSSPASAIPYQSSKFPIFSQGTLPNFGSTGSTAPTFCGTSNCGHSPSSNPKPSIVYTPPFTTSSSPGYNSAAGVNTGAGAVGIPKPNTDYPSTEKKIPYTGGFGGPSGILKPNEYSLPSKPVYPVSLAPAIPTSNLGSSAIPSTSYDVAPTSPSGLPKPGSCTSGNCGSHVSSSAPSQESSNSIKGISGANAGASATASANAVAYSGGFGGPPGLLKPNDGGKLDSLGSAGKLNAGYQNGVQAGNYATSADGSGASSGPHTGSDGSGSFLPYGTTGTASGSQAIAGAHSVAAAGAAAGALNSGSNNHGTGSSGGPSGGCSGGCGGVGSPYGGGHNFGLGGAVAGASAKSIAGATGGAGAGSYSQAGSFASSSANAQASAGYPTKGGYGR